jgi:hypothetical protein
MKIQRSVIALEGRLKQCRNVVTLGVRTNFSDYRPGESDLIRQADTIYYPTTFYADLFDAIGKNTFPSYHTYKCVQDKIKHFFIDQVLFGGLKDGGSAVADLENDDVIVRISDAGLSASGS